MSDEGDTEAVNMANLTANIRRRCGDLASLELKEQRERASHAHNLMTKGRRKT